MNIFKREKKINNNNNNKILEKKKKYIVSHLNIFEIIFLNNYLKIKKTYVNHYVIESSFETILKI
jgi:PIN domain nuclease of toxin-antitoxin system